MFNTDLGIVNVKIVGKKIYFKKIVNNIPMLMDLEKMDLPTSGILKKFPDLEGKPSNEIKREGGKRLNEYIAKMETQEEIKNYVIKELEGMGARLISIVKQGHRPIIIHKNLRRRRNAL